MDPTDEAVALRNVLKESHAIIKKLASSADVGSRLRLREEVRRQITRIDVYANGLKETELANMGDLPILSYVGPCFRITFINGAKRWVFADGKHAANPSAIVDLNLPLDEARRGLGQ